MIESIDTGIFTKTILNYILLFMLLQLSQFFPFVPLHPAPLLPQAIPTPLSMSMGPAYMFFHYFLTNIQVSKIYISVGGGIKMFMFGTSMGIGIGTSIPKYGNSWSLRSPPHLLPSVFTLVTFTSFLWMFLPSSVGNTGPLNFISIFKLNLSLGSIQVKFNKNYDRPQKMYVLKQHMGDGEKRHTTVIE